MGTDDKRPEIDSRIKEAIEDMYRNYRRLGYYGILDVQEHAEPAEIRSAYHEAAKKFHPDRHFGLADDALRNKLSEIFSYIYEAYATLSDPQKRQEYDKHMSIRPSRFTEKQDMAKERFENGKVQMKRGNFREAEMLFGQATFFDSGVAEYHYYYGAALSRQNRLKEAARALEQAHRLDPFNVEYLTELGLSLLGLGFPLRAKRAFEKALRLAPHDKRALEGMSRIKEEE